jgi:hypothetical protein
MQQLIHSKILKMNINACGLIIISYGLNLISFGLILISFGANQLVKGIVDAPANNGGTNDVKFLTCPLIYGNSGMK